MYQVLSKMLSASVDPRLCSEGLVTIEETVESVCKARVGLEATLSSSRHGKADQPLNTTGPAKTRLFVLWHHQNVPLSTPPCPAELALANS